MDEQKNNDPCGKQAARLLIADDEESMRYYLGRSLRRHGYEAETASDGAEAIARYEAQHFDLVVVDLKMPGADGLEVLAHIRSIDPEAVVILMTAYGTIRSAVEAMRQGAFDYITKPFEIDELLLLIERALAQRATMRENRALRTMIDSRKAYGGLIGQSPAIREVFQVIDLLRDSAAAVLITGESGTGKELLARAIHLHSTRADGAFVPVNCGALPESLLESELFGHMAGAFTGAVARKRGLVAQAHGGTLFLDEISEISPNAQVKLLRFLQDKKYTPVGGVEPLSVDLRVVSATNRDLEAQIEAERFREDLYFRLKVIPIALPPLRERREDIPLLVSHFLERYRKTENTAVKRFTFDAMIALSNYAWPGNVRELENTIERLVVLNADQEELGLDDLPETIWERSGATVQRSVRGKPVPFHEASSAFERDYLLDLLKQVQGNISQAARLSGISRSHLHQKVKQLDIDLARFRG